MAGISPSWGKRRLTDSCCVDEVAAEHIQADVVVHYGRACRSPYSLLAACAYCRTTRLPVIYVFGRRNVDIDSLALQFVQAVPDKDTNILLMCDTSYAYSLGTTISKPF